MSQNRTEAPSTIEDQCQQLTTELEKIELEYTQRQDKLSEYSNEVMRLKNLVEGKEIEQSAQKGDLDRQQKLYALLPEAPANLLRMKKLLETSKGKMALLEQQWAEIKNPLENEYKETMKKLENVSTRNQGFRLRFPLTFYFQTEAEILKSTLEHTISSLRQIVEEIRTKNDAKETLEIQLESLPPAFSTR